MVYDASPCLSYNIPLSPTLSYDIPYHLAYLLWYFVSLVSFRLSSFQCIVQYNKCVLIDNLPCWSVFGYSVLQDIFGL